MRQGRTERLQIIHEDASLIAVIKPAGLLSIGTPGGRDRTAYDILNLNLRRRGIREPVAVVHRLDRETSGVMLFARSGRAKKRLMDNWNDLVTRRIYIALVTGAPPEKAGTVRSFLKENAAHVMYSVGAHEGGLEAVTRYRVLASARGLSLLAVELETGRKNQIRVHMADLGCPVAGDGKYGRTWHGGDRPAMRNDPYGGTRLAARGRPDGRDRRGGVGNGTAGHGPGRRGSGAGSPADPLGRLGLHAWLITVRHPETGEQMTFTAPLPDGFLRAVGLAALPEEIL